MRHWIDSHVFAPTWFNRKVCKACYDDRFSHPGAEPVGAFEIWWDSWFGGWENKLFFAIAVYFGLQLWLFHSEASRLDLAFEGYWFGTALTTWSKSK